MNPGSRMRVRDLRRLDVLCSSGHQALVDQKFMRLKRWIIENGGFVHDALKLQTFDKPPYFTLRTQYTIDPDDVENPCLGVPSSIVIDRRRALEDLEAVLTRAGCPPLYSRQTIEILTLFIAYHKRQGDESMWYPAVSSLPENPPCPWMKQVRDLTELEFDEEVQEMIRKERGGNDLVIEQLYSLYGRFLGISAMELLWSYAQAQSISFHEPDGSFWPPLVHFIQHDRTQPPLYMHEDGRFVNWGWQDRLVFSGEDLKINIGIENPLLLYLTRGIVTENL